MTDEKETPPDGQQTPPTETRNLREELGSGTFEKIEDLPQSVRDLAEKHTRRAITEAREKWDRERGGQQGAESQDGATGSRNPNTPAEKPVTLAEIQEILRQDRLQMEREASAQRLMDSTLRELGIAEGTPAFDQVNQKYFEGLDKGLWVKEILSTKAGIRSVMLAAGVGQTSARTSGNHRVGSSIPDALNTGGQKYLRDELKDEGTHDSAAREAVNNRLREEGLFLDG